MLLICNACGGTDEGPSPAAVAVPLTLEFMQSLRRRRCVAQDLSDTARATGLDSLLFHEAWPQWLSWSEDLEELLHFAEATGWTITEDGRIAIADADDDPDLPHAVHTDCDLLQVWPERFQFVSCLRNSDTRLQSAMLYFDDFLTTAASIAPAAPGRHAA